MTRARTLLLAIRTCCCSWPRPVSACWAGTPGAANDRIPKGVTIAGIDVGGKSAAEARAILRRRVAERAARPVEVEVNGRTVELTAKEAKVGVAFDGAIRRALAAGEEGNFIERGWRELTGGEVDGNEKVVVAVNDRAVSAFVDRIARSVDKPAVDASLAISVDSVSVTRSQDGSRTSGPGEAAQADRPGAPQAQR